MLSIGAALNLGTLTPTAIALVLGSVPLMLLAVGARDAPASRTWRALCVACMATATLAYSSWVGSPIERILAPLLGASAAAVVIRRSGAALRVFVCLAVATLFAMIVVAWHWGSAPVDVFVSLQKASSALLGGHNPYLITFHTPDAIGPGKWLRPTIHFQYLPGVAVVSAPGRLVGDVRVIGVLASAVLVIFAARAASKTPGGRDRAVLATAVALALPLTVAMVHYAWVEVYSVLGLLGWVVVRRTHPRWAVSFLAFSLAIVPTILIALVVPAVWFRSARRDIIVAVALAALFTLPFALFTGLGAFYRDIIGVQVSLGFRYDGLTLDAAWYALAGHIPSVWLTLTTGLIFALVVVRGAPRDTSDVLLKSAMLATGAFLLSKWAFLNYYYIPAWLLILAIASRGIPWDAQVANARPLDAVTRIPA